MPDRYQVDPNSERVLNTG
ncbi:unnamed protein product, partial [Rotaria socialis]